MAGTKKVRYLHAYDIEYTLQAHSLFNCGVLKYIPQLLAHLVSNFKIVQMNSYDADWKKSKSLITVIRFDFPS